MADEGMGRQAGVNMAEMASANMASTMKAFGAVSSGWQTMAAEFADFSRGCMARNSDAFSRIMGARSLDKMMEAQGEYVRASFDAMTREMSRMNDILTSTASRVVETPAERGGMRKNA